MVLNSCFGRMILHIMFCRNVISFSVNHNFSSAYSALCDTIGGHFWANKLLRTCREFKVPIPTYICNIMLAKGMRIHSVYDYGGYILSYIRIVYKHRNIPVQ